MMYAAAQPIYNRIGDSYNTTRSADPYITDQIYELLSPDESGLYLDVGCGTANYLTALSRRGLQFYGVDPSVTMLEQARTKDSEAVFIRAKAEAIPLADAFFDGAIAMFTIHHWNDKLAGLRGVCRVLKPGARLVFLSFTPEQMKGYWLNEYFPKMMKRSWELLPDLPEMEQLLNAAGFSLAATEKYFIREDLQDHFLYSNKSRPAEYLKPEIRQNASSFSAFCDPDELACGLEALRADIDSGAIAQLMEDYENDKGDYLFLVAEKN